MRKNRVSKTCPICNRVFEVKASHAERRVWCSRECRAIGMRQRRQAEVEERFGKPIKPLLEELYAQGLGIKKISRKLGISDRVCWDWFDSLGIDRRERSDAVALQWVDNDERRQGQSERIKADFENGTRDPLRIVKVARTPWARKRNSQSKRGKNNPMYGKFGPLNGNWQGGMITYRGKGWRGIRIQVVRRDNYTCRCCGKKLRRHELDVHHIVPYRKTQDNSFSNLVTLCKPCHIKVEYHGATWG